MEDPVFMSNDIELRRAVSMADLCYVTVVFKDDTIAVRITKKQAREIIKQMAGQVEGMVLPDSPRILYLDRLS